MKRAIRGLMNEAANRTGLDELRDYSLIKAREYAKEKGISSSDTEADALQHITMSILLNQKVGNLPARAIQGLYEELAPNAGEREKEMDYHNNAIGRRIYERLPEEKQESLTFDEAFEMAKQHLEGTKEGLMTGAEDTPIYYEGLVREEDESGKFEKTGAKLESGKAALGLAAGGVVRAATKLSPTAAAVGATVASEDAEAAYIPLKAFTGDKATDAAKALHKKIKDFIDQGMDDAPGGELYQKTGAYRSEDGEIKVDVAELKARDVEMAQAVGKFTEDANFFLNNTKATRREMNRKMSDYLPANSPIFEYFPALKDAKVTLRRAKADENYQYGSYNPMTNEMTLLFKTDSGPDRRKVNLDSPVKAFNTLVHEFQHNIQDVLDARNTGFNTIATAIPQRNLRQQYEAAVKAVKENPSDEASRKLIEVMDAIPQDSKGALQHYEIYVRELGEMEARSSGRKAFLTQDDPARRQVGVLYPAGPKDPGTLSAEQILEEPTIPPEQALIRPDESDKFDLDFAFTERGKEAVKATAKASGVMAPSAALADTLGLPTIEKEQDFEQDEFNEMYSEPVRLTGQEMLLNAPVTWLPTTLADTFQSLADGKEEREDPETVDEFSDIGRGLNAGGLMENEYNATKLRQGGGVETKAGEEMAKKNPNKAIPDVADLDDDGKISSYEKTRHEAIEKAKASDKKTEMAMGGMMAMDADPFAPVQVVIGVDEVSGNEVPAGSRKEEVRDDIPAMLSEGEYVVPADVVRWHGLKTLEGLRCEAKHALGMMAMHERVSFVDDETKEPVDSDEEEKEKSAEDYDVEEEDVDVEESKPKTAKLFMGGLVNAARSAVSAATAPTPTTATPTFYRYEVRLDPATGRYRRVAIDPNTGQVVTAAQFDADRATRYSPRTVLGLGAQEPSCPEGYRYDEASDSCVPVQDVAPAPSVAAPASDSDGSSGVAASSPSVSDPSTVGMDYDFGYIPRGAQIAGGLLGGPLVGGAIALSNQNAIRNAQLAAGIEPETGLGGIIDRVRMDPYDTIGTTQINDNTYSINLGGGLTDEGRTGLTPFEAQKRRKDIAAWNAREDKPTALGVQSSGPSLDEISRQNQAAAEEAMGYTTSSSSDDDGGYTPPSQTPAQKAATTAIANQNQQSAYDAMGGGYSSSDNDSSSSTGGGSVVTDSSGNPVMSSSGPVQAPGPQDSGSDDSGGGGGGRYCCSQMVHHGIWSEGSQFARMSIWSKNMPTWWRKGYPIWGRQVAKHLLDREGFWTDVMQAFYDNHVRRQPKTWKALLADAIIFPGALVCSLWGKVPAGKPRVATKEQINA